MEIPRDLIETSAFRNYTVGSTWLFDGYDEPLTVITRYIARMVNGDIVFSLECRNGRGTLENVMSVRTLKSAQLISPSDGPTYDIFCFTTERTDPSVYAFTTGFRRMWADRIEIVEVSTGEVRCVGQFVPEFRKPEQIDLGKIFNGGVLFKMPDEAFTVVMDEHEHMLVLLSGGARVGANSLYF